MEVVRNPYHCLPVVGSSHAVEPFLTGSIPHLQPDSLPFQLNCFHHKVNPYSHESRTLAKSCMSPPASPQPTDC